MKVTVIGAGVVGLACALELAERGAEVEVIERSATLGASACSWRAGGMLAPWCEEESAEPLVRSLGEESMGWWAERFSGTVRNGTLVVAHGRDVAELTEFARRTTGHRLVNAEQLKALEPDLGDRFSRALYYEGEAHLDPRAALQALVKQLSARGVRIHFSTPMSDEEAVRLARSQNHAVVNCTGLAARNVLPDLRGVKGEMVIVRARDVSLKRPVRVLHPRIPIYVVPRDESLFMIGATMIESDDAGRVCVRSVLELLTAAYALNPAFGEAEVVELATGVRPAFLDNFPRITRRDGVLHVNGFFRHGFLLAPAMARTAADVVMNDRAEVTNEAHRQRQRA